MGLNPFDETLEELDADSPQAPAAENPFVAVIDSLDQSKETQLRGSMTEAVKTTPDTRAEALRFSQQTGLPTDVIERNFDDIKRRAKIADTPYAQMMRESPHLASWAETPNNLAIAHDDLENLGALEWLFTAPQRAVAQGINQVRFAQLKTESMFRPLTQQEEDLLGSYRSHMELGGALGAGDSWWRKAITGAAELGPNIAAGSAMAIKYGAAGAVSLGLPAAAAGSVLPGFGTVASGLAAGSVGLRSGMLYGGAKMGFQLEAGLALDEYQQFKDETGQPLDKDVARMAALATGLMNAGLEAYGLEKLAESIPGVTSITKFATRSAVKEALKRPTVRAGLLSAAKSYAGTLTAETATEVAQRAATILSGELAKSASGQNIPHRTPSDIFADLINEGVGAVQSFGLTVLPGPVLAATQARRQAQAAHGNADFFRAVGAGVTASKAAERSPDAVQDLVRRAVEHGPAPEVYAPVDTWTTYWQSKGIDPAEMATTITGEPRALEEAQVSGLLRIPTDRYALKLAPTEHNEFFASELKFRPDEMNTREAIAFQEAEVAKAETAQQAQLEPREQIRQQIGAKLTEAGVPQETAGNLAGLVEAGFGRLAESAGLDPLAVYSRYGIQVKRPISTDQPQAQAGAAPAAPAAEGVAEPPGLPLGEAEAPAALAADQTAGVAQGAAGGPATALEGDLGEIPGYSALAASLGGATLETPAEAGPATNASGESAASAEALSRTAGMRSRGESYVVYDRAGNRRTLLGPEAVDYVAQPGETYGIEGPTGFTTLENQGGKVGNAQAARALDNVRAAAQTSESQVGTDVGTQTGQRPADTSREQPAPDVTGGEQGAGDGGRAERRRLPTLNDILGVEGASIFKPASERKDRKRLTPEVTREIARIAEELGAFPFVSQTWNWDVPDKSGNAAGGDANIVAGAAGTPLYDDILNWAPLAESSKTKGKRGKRQASKGNLQSRGQVEAAAVKLAETGRISTNIMEGVVRVAERRAADDYREISRPLLPPSWGVEATPELVADLSDAIDTALEDADVSFDTSEFGQSMLDLFAPPPEVSTQEQSYRDAAANASAVAADPPAASAKNLRRAAGYLSHQLVVKRQQAEKLGKTLDKDVAAGIVNEMEWYTRLANEKDSGVDTLDTGEQQPRLPSAGTVRDQNVATPQVAEAPFSLTSETSKATKGKQTTLFQIPVDTARLIDMPVEMPSEPVFQQAVDNTAGAVVTADGLEIDLVRYQKPEQEGEQSVRTGVFYLPKGSAQEKYYRSTARRQGPVHYGGTQRIEGRSLYRRPLFVKGATGGNAIKAGYDAIKGKGAYEAMRTAILNGVVLRFGQSRQAIVPQLQAVLETFGADPNLAYEIVRNSTEGNTLAYAAQENIAAHAVRAAGYDSVIGWSKGRGAEGKPFLSEVFDVREVAYPTQDGDFMLHEDFQRFKHQQDRRGSIVIGPNRQVTINLFEQADLSTFLHETGHLFLEVFGDVVDQVSTLPLDQLTAEQRRLMADYGTLLTQLGVENRSEVGTEQHEQFARMFEAYLREGKAPSLALQEIFSRFRAWLLGVYRSLRQLNVTLTPEVIGVMDRMLATDHEIAAAEARGRLEPMFITAEDAGMSPERFALYRQTVEDAHRKATEQLDAKLQGEVRREQEAQWKAERAIIREAVAAEAYQAPVYKALAAIRSGENPDGSPLLEGMDVPPLKLSRQAIVDRYGLERLKRLPKPYIYTTVGGVDPDLVAERYGFSSGDELLTAIQQAEPLERAIDRETDSRMLAKHGSLLLDGSVSTAAQVASANEVREAVVRAELRALWDKANAVSPFVKQAEREGKQAVRDAKKEAAYERRWFEAETKLRIAIAEGRKQVEIDRIEADVSRLKALARGGAATIRAGIPSAVVLQQTAEARIARTRVKDLNPSVFWSASRKSAAEAIDAAARQDFDRAIEAKTNELLNLHLYRASETAKADVAERVAKARDLGSNKSRARIGLAGTTFLEQIDGILDRYNFAKLSQKELAKRARMRDWVEAMEAQGLPVDDLPPIVLDDLRRIDYQQVSVEELVGITDALAQIVHLARLKNRELKNAAAESFAATRDKVLESIRANNETKKQPIEFDAGEERKLAISDIFASHTKIGTLARMLDGHQDGGAMWEAIILPINEAADAEQRRRTEVGEGYRAIVEKHYPGRAVKELSEKVHIPAINDSLSKEARIAVALNWGNEISRSRILADPTRRWTEAGVEAILDTLDKRDWTFVTDTWRYLDRLWPEIAAKQERVTGLKPEKVEGMPVETKFGTFEGGYYPLSYDSRLVARAQQNEAASDAKLATAAAYVRTTTKRGHTIARLANVRLSVRLDLGVAFQHLDQVLHDLTHHEMLIDTTRLLRDQRVAAAILETRGSAVYQQFTRALESIAAGNIPARNMMDRAANFVRTGTQLSLMGWNLWTAAQQPLGLFNGMERVGVKWVARGMGRWLRDAATMEKTTEWIASVSPFMRDRVNTGTQDISDLRQAFLTPGGWFDDLLRTVTLDTITQQNLLDSYLWHISLMQRVADVPTWLGAYEKAMADRSNAGDEERAYRLADQAVRDAQGSGQISDLSQVQRGGPIARLFMTFYSYGNVVYNRTAANIDQFKQTSSASAFIGHMSLLYLAPAVGTVAMMHAFGKRPEEEPEEWLKEVGGEMLATALNTMVFLREFSSTVGEGTRGYAGPAGARFFQIGYDLVNQVKQGKADEGLFKAVNNAAGILFRYPAGQVQRTVDGFVALSEGRTHNPLALFFGAPPK